MQNKTCDPPYDFRDKGDSTLTTRFHLKTKAGYYTLVEHARAPLNEHHAFFSYHTLQTIKYALLNYEAQVSEQAKHVNLQIQKVACERTQHISMYHSMQPTC